MHAAVDMRIAAIARRQHGLVTRAQLRALGMCESGVSYRVAVGRLHRAHRGVFAVGVPPISERARWMAAVLAAGDGAVLDGRAAAQLHGIERPAWRHQRRRPIDVLDTRQHRAVPGIRFRRTRRLPASHVTKVDGIPVVTVARAIVNLAAEETSTTVCKLLDEAAYHDDRFDLDDVRDAAQLIRTRNAGDLTLELGLEQYEHGERGTDSELEEAALEFCRASGVPDPACNVYLWAQGERFRVDECWREERVVQEVNGSGHARPTRRRADRRRRRALRAVGWKYLVITRYHLVDSSARSRAASRLRNALAVASV